jgi:alkylation response protein AidB-like acyl-CoA dehydrogenase
MKFSSMAKVFGTDMSMEVCSDAIQILGGYGYMKDYGVEKYLRDAKVNQIMEGTNQVCRLAIMEGIMEEIGYEYKY